MNLYVEQLQIPSFCAGGFGLRSAVRKGSIVACEADADAFPVERFVVEFETEAIAANFDRDLSGEGASIQIDEDTSLEAAPANLRKAYLALRDSGESEELERVLTQLWEEYGISPENTAPRQTSGVRRIAIMHDDGVCAFGFNGMRKVLRAWMDEHGFPRRRGMLELD